MVGAWHVRKHENLKTRKGRQTRTFEPPVVQNNGLGLFELIISRLDQKGRPFRDQFLTWCNVFFARDDAEWIRSNFG